MSERTFDRETLLDLTVNIVPLGIIVFFIFVFLLVSPWGLDPFVMAISMGLLVVPFAVLALVTFVSGRAVARDEKSGGAAGELSASDASLDSGVDEELVSDDHPESDEDGEDDEGSEIESDGNDDDTESAGDEDDTGSDETDADGDDETDAN